MLPAEVASGSIHSPAALTFEEETKRQLPPLDVYLRLLDCVSANRPPDAGDRFRFQWFGLFYQAPERDAFTLRLRLPGGRLKLFQLAGLAEITQRHAGGQVVLNAQSGLDVPGVPLTSAARILHEVESVGFSARRTGGDCVQAIRGGEYGDPGPAGRGAPVYPLVCALEQAVIHTPVFADLPRPCEIVFQADGETFATDDPAMDTLILRNVAGDSTGENPGSSQEPSFLLLVPGEAKSGFQLSLDRLVPGCLELLRIWAADADRSSRENASLGKFLAGLDPDTFCARLGGAKRVPLPARASSGVPAVQSRRSPGCEVPGRRLLSEQLAALERCGREQGWQEVRLAHDRLRPIGPDSGSVEALAILRQVLSA